MAMVKNSTSLSSRNRSVDYFRAFLMILVVWHHSTLAYGTSGSGVLITDGPTFLGFDLIALFNDLFFMFGFFLISGLFAYRSLVKKGSQVFLQERLIRLMLPFAFGTLFINPLAHYAAQLAKQEEAFSFTGYGHFFVITFGDIESNHLWFLWVLFLFCLILVGYYELNRAFNLRFSTIQERLVQSVGGYAGVILIFGTIALVPMQALVGSDFITLVKPFNMQLSRLFLYLVYFVVGNIIGTYGIAKSFLGQVDVQKKWWRYILVSLGLTVFNLVIHIMVEMSGQGILKLVLSTMDHWMMIPISLFAVLGFFGFFSRYMSEDKPYMDVLAKDAMGIYVIHYTVITCIQYGLTFISLPGVLKGIGTTVVGLIISLALVRIFRKIPFIRTVFGEAYAPKYNKVLQVVTLIMLFILIVT